MTLGWHWPPAQVITEIHPEQKIGIGHGHYKQYSYAREAQYLAEMQGSPDPSSTEKERLRWYLASSAGRSS